MTAQTRSVLLAVLAASALAAAPAASLVIDNFEVGDFVHSDDSTTPGGSLIENGGLPSGVVGGTRYVRQRVTTTNELLPAVSSAILVTTPADDAVALSSVGADLNVETEFGYDGVLDNDVTGVGGTLDLDLSGFSIFRILASAPAVDATVLVTLWSSTTARTSGLIPLVDGATRIPLGNFTLDLSDIQSIRVEIDGLGDGEVVNVSSFSVVVPEPTTGLLLASGLVAMAHRRRR